MADANINATVSQLHPGGKIKIKKVGTSDVMTVLNVEKGTFKYTAGLWESKEYTSNDGTLQNPLQGDAQPTTLELTARFTSDVGVNELEAYLAASGVTASTNQRAPLYEVVIESPTYVGSATGKKYTFAKCMVESIELTAGSPFDLIRVSMRDQEPYPVIAAI